MNKHPLEKHFLAHCLQKRFFDPGDRVLLAVSGGMDSCVLLYLFLMVRDDLKISLGMAHVNHGLRDRESDSDEVFVESLAHSHSVRFHRTRLDVKEKADRERRSIEEAARLARYAYLESVAQQEDYRKICTGHHMDDQAETVLSRVLKGAGWEGLAGIRETRGDIVRPLLSFSRTDLQKYAKEKNILYVADNSNNDLRFYRNKIRHQLIPALQSEFDPQVIRHLHQLSVIARETEEYLTDCAPQWFRETTRSEGNKIILDIQSFKRYFFIQRKLILSLILKKLFDNDPDTKPTYYDYQAMLQLTESSQSGRRYIIGSAECVREHDRLIFQPVNSEADAFFDYPVSIGTVNIWDTPSVRFSASPVAKNDFSASQLGKSPAVEYADAQKIRGQLFIRSWKTGDAFLPIGMNAAKKLSDFFTDGKIPLSERNRIPILVDRTGSEERIVWICGYRLDNRYKIDDNTQHIIRLECHGQTQKPHY